MAVTVAMALTALLLTLAVTMRDAEATFPGENGRIAFASNHTTGEGVNNPEGDFEIYTMNADGSGTKNLAKHPAGDFTPIGNHHASHVGRGDPLGSWGRHAVPPCLKVDQRGTDVPIAQLGAGRDDGFLRRTSSDSNVEEREDNMKVQHTVVISAPVELVFGFAANYENDPRWRSEVRQIRYTSRSVSVGTKAIETSSILGRELETVTVVTEYKENRRVASRSISGPVPVVVSRDFETVSGGTRFTYTLEGDVSGVLLFRVSQPILVRWCQRQLEGYLRTLKSLLEAAPTLTSVDIRAAVAGDQGEINALVRAARINPRNLDWRRFMVAEDRGRVVGIRQVKVHKNGTREVASGVVLPEYRRRNISADLMRAVLARESGPLFLMCDAKWSRYYEQFGFHRVRPYGLPVDFRREYRIGRIVTSLLSLFARRKIRIIPMKREEYPTGSTYDDPKTTRHKDSAASEVR